MRKHIERLSDESLRTAVGGAMVVKDDFLIIGGKAFDVGHPTEKLERIYRLLVLVLNVIGIKASFLDNDDVKPKPRQ